MLKHRFHQTSILKQGFHKKLLETIILCNRIDYSKIRSTSIHVYKIMYVYLSLIYQNFSQMRLAFINVYMSIDIYIKTFT